MFFWIYYGQTYVASSNPYGKKISYKNKKEDLKSPKIITHSFILQNSSFSSAP